MTISPPSNVNTENIINSPVRILTSGFDRLILSADVKWNDESLFVYFADLKAQAKANNKEVPGTLGTDEHMKWFFNMYPSGAKGWEWILKGQEFTLTIGDWLTPISRPSIMIDIASETLWRVGPRDSVELIMHLINSIGGKIATIKPSRVDLCMDVLMPDGLWIDELKDYRVTRARKFSPYYENERLTGMMIGRGDVCARLYDKIFEIETQSKKFWMFDIWRLEEIPEEQRVIRVEFQLRREMIKNMGIDAIEDLFAHSENLWAYCTKGWLKFQDRPGLHTIQRKTFTWWQQIQNDFMGVQEPVPLIRSKAIRIDEEQMRKQTLGFMTSWVAVEMVMNGIDDPLRKGFKDTVLALFNNIEAIGKDDEDFYNEVMRKWANYHRAMVKMNQALETRFALGFPTGKGNGKRFN